MGLYDDIYVRDNFDDIGQTPTTGIPYQSPDIIPYRSDILTLAEAVTTYDGPDIGQPVIASTANNVYVRAKNLSSESETGGCQLYYSLASLLLTPDSWLVNPVRTSQNVPYVPFIGSSSDLASQEVALSEPCFVLESAQTPAEGQHYCFVTIVSTPEHVVAIPESFATNAAFEQWVQNTPAVAYRNIVVVSATQPPLVINMAFGNLDTDAGQFYFLFMGRNWPEDTTVLATCQEYPIKYMGQFGPAGPDGSGPSPPSRRCPDRPAECSR